MRLLYSAAHGGFAGQSVPLGGGAAICNLLMEEWSRTRPFDVTLLSPSILGADAPSARDLVTFGERDYARFCVRFSDAVTREVLRHDPRECAVLCNDISEGPDFRALAAAGHRVSVIYHVDVAAYIADVYLRGWLRPETLVRWQARMPAWTQPLILDLIFRKQRDTVECAERLIVPSEGMREVLTRCYGAEAGRKTVVLPWGGRGVDRDEASGHALRREFGVPDHALVLLTLSRISPEKGQDLLLEALRDWRPDTETWLFLCGEPAFMKGEAYARRLRSLASRVRGVRVEFPGYVAGERKRAFYSAADIYCFPSRHESYGLTLLEALSAGLPCVCLDHAGARSVMRPEFGAIVPASGAVPGLRAAIDRLGRDADIRRRMGAAGRSWASTQRFEDTAARLAGLLRAQ